MSGSKPDRAPGRIWTLRWPPCKAGQTNGKVITMPGDYIGIGVWGDHNVGPGSIVLTRRDARLLAKRITECLDATAKR